MGMFNESYTKVTLRLSFWQRIQLLFCKNVQVIAKSGDYHESIEFKFNVKKAGLYD